MSLDWQTAVALLCVIGAGVVIVLRVVSFLASQKSGCGGSCAGCGSTTSQTPGSTLISLSLPPQKADQAG